MVISGMKTENSNCGRCKNTCNKINIDHLPRSTGFVFFKDLAILQQEIAILLPPSGRQEDSNFSMQGYFCQTVLCPGESALQCSHKYYHPGPGALMPILPLSSLMPVYREGPILGHSGWSGDNRQP
uniref:Uncharacterized protein n=1 Tax=Micrurus corallinus TaxID=54390 RepID=A0A2D4EYI3_MICCO